MRFLITSFVCLAVVLPALAEDGPARSPENLVRKSVEDLAHGKVGAAVKDDVKALRRGPLLMHGNYCGIGNRPGTAPVDALDAACMRHDACTKEGKLPSCACDDRLRVEATDVANDAATPADVRTIALATASAMAVLICKKGPGETAPASAPAAAPAPPADAGGAEPPPY